MTSLRDLTSDILHAPPQRDHATNVPVYELTEQGLREFAARVLEDAADQFNPWSVHNDSKSELATEALRHLAKKWRQG